MSSGLSICHRTSSLKDTRPGLYQPSFTVRDSLGVIEWEEELASLRTSLTPGPTLGPFTPRVLDK